MILNENYSILVELFCRPYFWRYSCMSAIALRKPYFWRHSCMSAIALWISDTLSCWQKCRILLIFIHFCRWGNICRQILPTQVCIAESMVFSDGQYFMSAKIFPNIPTPTACWHNDLHRQNLYDAIWLFPTCLCVSPKHDFCCSEDISNHQEKIWGERASPCLRPLDGIVDAFFPVHANREGNCGH